MFTAAAHEKRGTCCGSACRHCPFGHFSVKGLRKACLSTSSLLKPQRRKADVVRSYTSAVLVSGCCASVSVDVLVAQLSIAAASSLLLLLPFHKRSYTVAAVAGAAGGGAVGAAAESAPVCVDAAFDLALACGIDVLAVAARDELGPAEAVGMADIHDAAAQIAGIRLLPAVSAVPAGASEAVDGDCGPGRLGEACEGGAGAAAHDDGSRASVSLLWHVAPLKSA